MDMILNIDTDFICEFLKYQQGRFSNGYVNSYFVGNEKEVIN